MNSSQPTNDSESPIDLLREQAKNIIREWVKVDNEISTIRSNLKLHNKRKSEITTELINNMNAQNIDCFNTRDGKIVCKRKNQKSGISGKFLIAQLNDYYASHPSVATDIANHILNNRKEKVTYDIKRTVVNKK